MTGLAPDDRFARYSAGVYQYYLTDAVGSVVALTDQNGVVQTQYTYGPFGQTTSTGTASDNPYQFGGRELDPNGGNGIYYFRARYYDSLELNRFMARDPQGLSGGNYATLYAYVGNSPLNGTDPTGEFTFGSFGGLSDAWSDAIGLLGGNIATISAPGGDPTFTDVQVGGGSSDDGLSISAATARNNSSQQGSNSTISGLSPQEFMALADAGIIVGDLVLLTAEGSGGEISAFGLTAYAVGTATVVVGESAMAIAEGINNPANFGIQGVATIGTRAGAPSVNPSAPPTASP
jgi:RHS repeat-associated protein